MGIDGLFLVTILLAPELTRLAQPDMMKYKPVRILLFLAILIVLSGMAVYLLGQAPGSRDCLERFSGGGSEPCRPDQVGFWWRLAVEVLSAAAIGLVVSGTAWGAALLGLLFRQSRPV